MNNLPIVSYKLLDNGKVEITFVNGEKQIIDKYTFENSSDLNFMVFIIPNEK